MEFSVFIKKPQSIRHCKTFQSKQSQDNYKCEIASYLAMTLQIDIQLC